MNLKKTGAEVELCLKWLCSSDQNVVIDKEINDILSLLTDEHCVWPAGVNVDRLKTVFVEPPPLVMNPLGTWTTYSNRRREKVVSYCEMLLNDGHEKEFLDFIIDLFEWVKNDFITVGVISPADRACNTDNEIDFNPSGIIQALLSATTLGFLIRQSVANGKITSDKTLAVLSRIVAVLGHYCFRILEPCKNIPPTGYFNDMKDFASGELSQLAAAMKQTSLSFEEVGKIYKSALAVRHPDWYNVQNACHPDHAKESTVYNSNDLLECPVCGKHTDSLKRCNFTGVGFYLIFFSIYSHDITACPECMRKCIKILMKKYIFRANILYPLVLLCAWINFCKIRKRGHSGNLFKKGW